VTDRGAVAGNATKNNKCRCDSPNQKVEVQLPGSDDDVDFCINPAAAVAAAEAAARCERQKAVVRALYDLVIYPRNLGVLSHQIDVSNLFSPNVRGRVTPLGVFPSFLGVTEYFYGLASTPQATISKITERELKCEGRVTTGRMDLVLDGSQDPTRTPANAFVNFTHVFRIVHDDQARAYSMDVQFQNLGAALDRAADETFTIPGVGTLNVRQTYVAGMCQLLSQTCTGPLQAYPSIEQCIGFNLGAIPYGSYNRVNSNTSVCRQLHALLTIYRPDVHCAHASPSGGGACQDFPASSYYSDLVENDYTATQLP